MPARVDGLWRAWLGLVAREVWRASVPLVATHHGDLAFWVTLLRHYSFGADTFVTLHFWRRRFSDTFPTLSTNV